MSTVHPAETNGATITSWVPLTTTFPAVPDACSAAIYSQLGTHGQLIAFDPFFGADVSTAFTTLCNPQQASDWWNVNPSTGPNNFVTVSSIGPIVCPAAYSQVASVVMGGGKTQIACCPNGYAMQTAIMDRQSLGQCKSTISPSETLSYFTAGTVGPWTMTSTVAGPSGATVVGIQLNGYNFGESIASSTSESSTPTPATNGSTPYTVSLVPTSTASSGLSSGAKIGLGVAIPLVVVGLCLVAGFLLYRRRNSKSPPVATTSAMEISRDDAKYDPTYGQMHQKYYQLPPSELHAPPPELPASQPVEPVYELGNSIHVR